MSEELDDFRAPMPLAETIEGYWVPKEQYDAILRERDDWKRRHTVDSKGYQETCHSLANERDEAEAERDALRAALEALQPASRHWLRGCALIDCHVCAEGVKALGRADALLAASSVQKGT